jgi:hypothetical protein
VAAAVKSVQPTKSKFDLSPLSPEQGRSFIAAVINAIRSATTNTMTTNATSKQAASKHAAIKTGGDESDSTEMLNSETKPCLMKENVLEDVLVPDSHSNQPNTN